MSGERLPLLLGGKESLDLPVRQVGTASVRQTVINLAKTCMGTGTLALPFAAREGGIWLNTMGLFAIAGWNIYAVERLCHCLELLPIHKRQRLPPDGTSTLGKVAWYAFGTKGLHVLDMMMVILLSGIIVAYEDAIMSFLRDTPFTTGSGTLDSLGIAIIMGFLSVVPNMGYLSRASAAGLTVLFVTFTVIAGYGSYSGVAAWNWWPKHGLVGISHWFGCVVFGFGVVPLTYNMQEAMLHPSRMMNATFAALIAVGIAYIILGMGLLVLYPNVEGDILQELPKGGFLPTAVRMAMILVVMVTAPLLVVPCGELIEGKLFAGDVNTSTRVVVRLAICIACTLISVWVPEFVYVLSFVGCFCVALVSFVIPPLLHLVLAWFAEPPIVAPTTMTMVVDLVMLVWGLVATIISSVFTFQKIPR